MLRTPAFLGFSMVRRNNRRLLVTTTYVVFVVLMATVIVILPSQRLFNAIWMCLVLAYNVVNRAILGRLVKDMTLPELRGGRMTSLGLSPISHGGEDDPDEREVAVRNAAHFEAYRALAVYSMLIWLASPLFLSLSGSTAVRVLLLTSMPLLAMVFTLPQAIVLWTEPDVPEEARV